jgi:NAD-dependent SIR2 family protein deacetylase
VFKIIIEGETMNIAIFLGAGASKAEGAPIQGELFKEFFSINNRNIKQIQSSLIDFLQTFFQIDGIGQNETIKYPTFEEVLGIIDLAEMKHESFGKYKSISYERNSNKSFSKIKKDLILMMAFTLQHKLMDYTREHLQLVHRLKNLGVLVNTTFITTNYDILLDNAHEDVYPEILLDYGIEFSNGDSNWKNVTENDQFSSLFKLHGSLNWLYCSDCKDIELTQFNKGVTWLINNQNHAKCKNCGSLRLPVIIPPTYFKDYSNIFINNIWHKAELALRETEYLFFSGYSLPDADINVKYLLKRVQLYRQSRGLPFKITVFNNHENKGSSEKDEEENRFKRFFGPNVEYTNYSFNQLRSKIEMYLTSEEESIINYI